jgi:nucleotide-binding universal stress UspA family protein
MQVKRILWATDGSKESDDALTWAKFLATRFGAKVIALNVLEPLNVETLELADDLKKQISRIESGTGKMEGRRLTRIRNMLQKIGIKAEPRVARGIPQEEITKAALSGGIDLIAMGKRGLTPSGSMLLGSTTSAVLRDARVPILTVRRAKKKPAIKKILVPTSFSPGDIVALEWALDLARKTGAALVLLHVIEVHKSYDAVKGGFMGRLRDAAVKRLQGIVDSVPAEKRKDVELVEKVTAFPRAWSGIINFARNQGIDIIVTSTHARKGVPRFFLGSVAENVIKEAPCPVITINPV